jgi:hypothetical protein
MYSELKDNTMKLNKKNLLLLGSIGVLSSYSFAYDLSLPLDVLLRCRDNAQTQITKWRVNIVNNSLIPIKVNAENVDNAPWSDTSENDSFSNERTILPQKAFTGITQINDCDPYPASGLKLKRILIKNTATNVVLKSINLGSYTGAKTLPRSANYDTSQFLNLAPLSFDVVNNYRQFPNFVWGIPKKDVKYNPQRIPADNLIDTPASLTFLPDGAWNGKNKDIFIKLIYNDGDKLELDILNN